VVLLDKEVKENETLILKPIAMIGEQEMPLLVSSNWVFERVKTFCHVVGTSCDNFDNQMLALFSTIEVSRHQTKSISILDFCFTTTN
jgi:hypothetical protein